MGGFRNWRNHDGRTMNNKKCIFCGGRAGLLCDSFLGWQRKTGAMEREAPNLRMLRADDVPQKYRLFHTCDAPLCEACTSSHGAVHFKFRTGHLIDSIDFCPGHDFGSLAEITGLQAEAMRAKWRASARAKLRQDSKIKQIDLFTGLLQ